MDGLVIGGEKIRRVEGARFLGVWVDEGLGWTGQIDRVARKVGRLLGVRFIMVWSSLTFSIV